MFFVFFWIFNIGIFLRLLLSLVGQFLDSCFSAFFFFSSLFLGCFVFLGNISSQTSGIKSELDKGTVWRCPIRNYSSFYPVKLLLNNILCSVASSNSIHFYPFHCLKLENIPRCRDVNDEIIDLLKIVC